MITPSNLTSNKNSAATKRLVQKKLTPVHKRQNRKLLLKKIEKNWMIDYSYLFIPLY